jgi:hypothetical protein
VAVTIRRFTPSGAVEVRHIGGATGIYPFVRGGAERRAGLRNPSVETLGYFRQQLQEENGRLKRLVADLTLDKAMLQDVLSRKV